MSVEQLQQRLSDLRFSIEEQIKYYENEQAHSENAHSAWEDEGKGLEGDAADEHESDEPDVIDNDAKVNALESAKDKLDEAIDALDGALED